MSNGILLPFSGDIILGVKLYGLAVIRDGFFILVYKVIKRASTDICNSILRVYFYGLIVIRNGLIKPIFLKILSTNIAKRGK